MASTNFHAMEKNLGPTVTRHLTEATALDICVMPNGIRVVVYQANQKSFSMISPPYYELRDGLITISSLVKGNKNDIPFTLEICSGCNSSEFPLAVVENPKHLKLLVLPVSSLDGMLWLPVLSRPLPKLRTRIFPQLETLSIKGWVCEAFGRPGRDSFGWIRDGSFGCSTIRIDGRCYSCATSADLLPLCLDLICPLSLHLPDPRNILFCRPVLDGLQG